MILNVEIFVDYNDYLPEAGKLIKGVSGLPYSVIKSNVSNGKPLFACAIDNTKFYKGIDDILVVLDRLRGMGIVHSIKSNNDEIDRSFLDQIKSDLKNISLQDIR